MNIQPKNEYSTQNPFIGYGRNPTIFRNFVLSMDKNTPLEHFKIMCKTVPFYTFDVGCPSTGQTALHKAAMLGHLHLIDHLTNEKPEELLFLCDKNGLTPLHCTVFCDDPDLGLLAAKKLIELGTPIDTQTIYSFDFQASNLLELAIEATSKKIAILCLSFGMKCSKEWLEERDAFRNVFSLDIATDEDFLRDCYKEIISKG